MAAKINWHRYGTKLRHCHYLIVNGPRYTRSHDRTELRCIRVTKILQYCYVLFSAKMKQKIQNNYFMTYFHARISSIVSIVVV